MVLGQLTQTIHPHVHILRFQYLKRLHNICSRSDFLKIVIHFNTSTDFNKQVF